MTDTAVIIKAVNEIHKSMNAGFGKIHEKIEKRFGECDDRLTDVETEMKVKKALCKKEKESRDYWRFTIRAITVAGIVSLFTIAWSKITALLDLVP